MSQVYLFGFINEQCNGNPWKKQVQNLPVIVNASVLVCSEHEISGMEVTSFILQVDNRWTEFYENG
jgi:hypothetical protein